MPSVPKWFADTIEKVSGRHYHPVTVTRTKYYTPKLKLVRFEGELAYPGFLPGNVVEFRINHNDFRHYSPSMYDYRENICEVLFYLHDRGVGSKWAASLSNGNSLKLMGPAGKMDYETKYQRHVFFGDETSIGAALCMEQFALEQSHHFLGLLEMEEENKGFMGTVTFSKTGVVRSSCESPAKHAVEFFNGESLKHPEESIFYLTGRAKSIQAVRKCLISRNIPSKQIKADPYWAEGKKGL